MREEDKIAAAWARERRAALASTAASAALTLPRLGAARWNRRAAPGGRSVGADDYSTHICDSELRAAIGFDSFGKAASQQSHQGRLRNATAGSAKAPSATHVIGSSLLKEKT